MNEDTAEVVVTLRIRLTAEPGAPGTDQPGISAEDKATRIVQLVQDQCNSIKSFYDTGVEIVKPDSKITYTAKDTVALG